MRRARKGAGVAAALVVCTVSHLAIAGAGEPSIHLRKGDRVKSGTGSLVVVVVDSLTWKPLTRGYVCIPGTDWMPGPEGAMWKDELDSLGRARLSGVPVGAYELGVGAVDHGFRSVGVRVVNEQTDTLRISLPPGPRPPAPDSLHYRDSGRSGEVRFIFDGADSVLFKARAIGSLRKRGKKRPRP